MSDQEFTYTTLIEGDDLQKKSLNLRSEDMINDDYPWILKSTVNTINIYSDNEQVNVILNLLKVEKDLNKVKADMEDRNTYIWSFLQNIGILTAIWAQTERFGDFWRGPKIQQYLFKNPTPTPYLEVWGPH